MNGQFPILQSESIILAADGIIRSLSWSLLRCNEIICQWGRPIHKLPILARQVAGRAVGVITVYATMPFDNIVTKLQEMGGGVAYRGSVDCIQDIVRRKGI